MHTLKLDFETEDGEPVTITGKYYAGIPEERYDRYGSGTPGDAPTVYDVTALDEGGNQVALSGFDQNRAWRALLAEAEVMA